MTDNAPGDVRAMRHFIIVATWTLANALAASAALSDPTRHGIQYDAAWFARFSPRNAFDMVKQTPGFVLIETDEERRGYSGAVGNVLVDGARPSAKEQTLTAILQQIPATQVVRIELLRGAEAAADASGEALLLNVVRTRVSGQGMWTGGFEHFPGHTPAPNAFMSWAGRVRSVDGAAGASTYSLRRELPGTRELTDGAGEATGQRFDTSPRDYAEYALNGEAGADLWGGRFRLTGKGQYSRYHEDSRVDTVALTGDRTESEFNPYTESKRTGEVGAHFARRVGSWGLTAVALLTRRHFESEAGSTHLNADATADSIFAQGATRASGESILRSTVARDFSSRHRLEVGIEGALNTLDARLHVTLALPLVSGDEPFPVPIDNANVAIEERRADAFVAHTWRPNGRWSLESRLAGEISRLEFTGDTNQSVDLRFVKPSLQLVRGLGERNQLRVRVAREVGQLDFTDFVSAVSLADDRINGGNPDLRPETAWLAEIAADLRWRTDVAIGIGVFRRWLDDTVDFVPMGTEDAPGNIGSAHVYGAKVALSAPLAPVLQRSALTLDATWSESAVTDPITGGKRTISEFERLRLKAGLRQDLPQYRLAWGLDYKRVSSITRFRLGEIDTSRISPSLDVFTEIALPRGMRLKFVVVSVLGSPELRDRTLFVTDRNGPIERIESGARRPGRWFQLFVSGSIN